MVGELKSPKKELHRELHSSDVSRSSRLFSRLKEKLAAFAVVGTLIGSPAYADEPSKPSPQTTQQSQTVPRLALPVLGNELYEPGGPIHFIGNEEHNGPFPVFVNSRAVILAHLTGAARYEFQAMERFRQYTNGSSSAERPPFRVLYLELDAQYEYLSFTARKVSAVEVNGPFLSLNDPTSAQASGHLIGITPRLGFGWSILGQPMILDLHITGGYSTGFIPGVQATVQDGNKYVLGVNEQAPVLGAYGFELITPGVEGRRWFFRLERLGAGAVGYPDNAYGFATLSFNWVTRDRFAFRSLLTPEVTNFGTVRVGGDIRPADFAFAAGNRGSLLLGPGLGIRYDVLHDGVTFDAYGRLSYVNRGGSEVSLRAGAVVDHEVREQDQIPTSPFASLNFLLPL